jgi:hypothetical protein
MIELPWTHINYYPFGSQFGVVDQLPYRPSAKRKASMALARKDFGANISASAPKRSTSPRNAQAPE